MFIAECPQVGTISQEKTMEETMDNLKEATELYLEEIPLEQEHLPIVTTFEVSMKGEKERVRT